MSLPPSPPQLALASLPASSTCRRLGVAAQRADQRRWCPRWDLRPRLTSGWSASWHPTPPSEAQVERPPPSSAPACREGPCRRPGRHLPLPASASPRGRLRRKPPRVRTLSPPASHRAEAARSSPVTKSRLRRPPVAAASTHQAMTQVSAAWTAPSRMIRDVPSTEKRRRRPYLEPSAARCGICCAGLGQTHPRRRSWPARKPLPTAPEWRTAPAIIAGRTGSRAEPRAPEPAPPHALACCAGVAVPPGDHDATARGASHHGGTTWL
jgi:hypothetical protein